MTTSQAPGPGYGYGFDTVAPTTNGFAVASLVCGIVGCFVMVTSPLAVVFGHVAKKQLRRSPQKGAGFASAGLITGYIGLFFLLLVLWMVVDSALDGTLTS